PPAHHDASLPPTLGATALVPTPSGQACPTAPRRPYLCVCRGVGLAELVVGRALASSEWFSVPERTPHTHLRVPLTLHTAMILVTPRRSGRPWPPSQDSGSIRLCRSAVRADGDAVFWSAVITRGCVMVGIQLPCGTRGRPRLHHGLYAAARALSTSHRHWYN